MDPLGDLLDGVRARTAAFCRSVLDPPWALRIVDEAPLGLATPLRGHAWVIPDDGEPTFVGTGDVAVVQGPEPYTVASSVDVPPTVFVHPGNRLVTTDGTDITAATRLAAGTSALGLGTHGATVIASGAYQVSSFVSGRLLATLPAVVRVPREQVQSPIMDLLHAEMDRDEPGQQVVLDRLLDLALIATLRAWFARPAGDPPGWYRAHGDPCVGQALRIMHEEPHRQWTVAGLAAATGVSRAAFARRFTDLVGQPPMTYLTHWRLDLAAESLRTTDATIATIARRVGYANAFALTVAFKRVRGATPQQFRAGLAAA
ncbi:putative AraC-family transcriptional regulator [Actinoplanes missouriensis 431]|uniref:Putative AraC-family transcriptional regulator n=1 Tax=Actinoplanes missouriensis (strain ATCC 14538 / DSM 43046 / CBS 188.64 / JCM 3121 / NBRC 102363 / NCIMB 12654 / NRRL B-3342 / UNCC 431) TaxID=512565 RepID=I0HAI1_ACTM4|nr:AraC family transcriptional regulator [Actinoplanes missouriensis]BAL90018.1 putative AraC-family transcriptional regulator [Actinoplanes missouriensis 431]